MGYFHGLGPDHLTGNLAGTFSHLGKRIKKKEPLSLINFFLILAIKGHWDFRP